MKSEVRKRLRKNRIIAVFVGVAAVFFCILLITQILQVRSKNAEMEARNARLDEQIAHQQNLRQDEHDQEDGDQGAAEDALPDADDGALRADPAQDEPR